MIGGNGHQLLSLAAREADIVGLSGIGFRDGGRAPPDLSGWRTAAVDERIALVRKVAGEERFARLEIEALVQQVIITDDRRRAAAELTTRWPQLGSDDILEAPYVLIGSVEQIQYLQACRERWRISSPYRPGAFHGSFCAHRRAAERKVATGREGSHNADGS